MKSVWAPKLDFPQYGKAADSWVTYQCLRRTRVSIKDILPDTRLKCYAQVWYVSGLGLLLYGLGYDTKWGLPFWDPSDSS